MSFIEWKDVPGYEGIYEVSNDGQIRSISRYIKLPTYQKYIQGRILKHWITRDGYAQLSLFKEGKRVYHYVHRLVGSAFLPNNEQKPQINHIDGNRSNNQLSNIEWVTCAENRIHTVKCGLDAKRKGIPTRPIRVIDIKNQVEYPSLKAWSASRGMSIRTAWNILSKKTDPASAGLRFVMRLKCIKKPLLLVI